MPRRKSLTIRLGGGLGNQMFVYAFARYMQTYGFAITLDTSVYEDNEGGGAVVKIAHLS